MDDYETVLYIVAILAICFIVYLFYKILVLLYRRNRLSDFGLELKDTDKTVSFRYKFLYRFANLLEDMVIFNGIARTYDKYVDEDSKVRKGIDYIAIKILFSIGFVLLYCFMMMLYKDKVNPIIGVITLVLGYVIPDFYCYFKYHREKDIKTKDLLGAIIIIRNSYRVNRSNEQVINDVIKRTNGALKDEFKKVLSDIKVGLSISDAFKRMYDRTKIDIILEIANMLSLTNKTSIYITPVFEEIEKKLINYEKFDNEVKMLQSINKLAYWIFLILPFIFIIFVIVSNQIYLDLLISNGGYIVIPVLIIIYALYILIINKIVRGRYL